MDSNELIYDSEEETKEEEEFLEREKKAKASRKKVNIIDETDTKIQEVYDKE